MGEHNNIEGSDPWGVIRRYVGKPGETLGTIEQTCKLENSEELERFNPHLPPQPTTSIQGIAVAIPSGCALGMDLPSVPTTPQLSAERLSHSHQPRIGVYYVRRGDTLSALRQELRNDNIPASVLLDLNPKLKNDDRLNLGQEIKLPSDAGPMIRQYTYTVQEQNGLARLSQFVHMSTRELLLYNIDLQHSMALRTTQGSRAHHEILSKSKEFEALLRNANDLKAGMTVRIPPKTRLGYALLLLEKYAGHTTKYDRTIKKLTNAYNATVPHKSHHIPPALVMGVVAVETSFKEGLVSKVGALGLMQVRPETAADMLSATIGIKKKNPAVSGWNKAQRAKARAYLLKSPENQVRAGIAYLGWLSQLPHLQTAAGTPDWEKVVAAFNAGPGRLEKRQGRPIAALNLKETKAYVPAVLVLADYFRLQARPDNTMPQGELFSMNLFATSGRAKR